MRSASCEEGMYHTLLRKGERSDVLGSEGSVRFITKESHLLTSPCEPLVAQRCSERVI